MPAHDQPRAGRFRNWVVSAVLVVVVVVVGIVAANPATGPRPKVLFGAQVQPVGAATIDYNNGWTAAAGGRKIGVYAGSEKADRRNGLLIVARLSAGRHRIRSIVLHGTGTVTLLKPTAPKSEEDALTATLRFVTANGVTGELDLNDDHVALSH